MRIGRWFFFVFNCVRARRGGGGGYSIGSIRFTWNVLSNVLWIRIRWIRPDPYHRYLSQRSKEISYTKFNIIIFNALLRYLFYVIFFSMAKKMISLSLFPQLSPSPFALSSSSSPSLISLRIAENKNNSKGETQRTIHFLLPIDTDLAYWFCLLGGNRQNYTTKNISRHGPRPIPNVCNPFPTTLGSHYSFSRYL